MLFRSDRLQRAVVLHGIFRDLEYYRPSGPLGGIGEGGGVFEMDHIEGAQPGAGPLGGEGKFAQRGEHQLPDATPTVSSRLA